MCTCPAYCCKRLLLVNPEVWIDSPSAHSLWVPSFPHYTFYCAGDTQKRQFLAALTSSADQVFPFLCRMLEQSFLAANQCQAKGDTTGAQSHTAGMG